MSKLFKLLSGLIVSFSTIVLVPWKNLKGFLNGDLVLIKKESGIRLDANKALNDVLASYNDRDQLLEKIKSMEAEKSDLLFKEITLNNKILALDNSYKSLELNYTLLNQNYDVLKSLNLNAAFFYKCALGLGFLSVLFFINWLKTRKKLKKMVSMTRKLTNKNNQLLTFAKNRQIALNNLHNSKLEIIEKLNKDIEDLKKLDFSENRAFIINEVKKQNKNHIKKTFLIVEEHLNNFLKNFKNKMNLFEKDNLLLLENKIFKHRVFNQAKTPSHILIYSALSIACFYYLIDLGLSDLHKPGLLVNCIDEEFYAHLSSPNTFLSKIIINDSDFIIENRDLSEQIVKEQRIAFSNIQKKLNNMIKQ